MDFITQLPVTKEGHDSIFVVVDRLTKMTHLIPTHTTVTARGVAHLFKDHVWVHHGYPKTLSRTEIQSLPVFSGRNFRSVVALNTTNPQLTTRKRMVKRRG
jgi:hypothetical protein